MRLQQFKVYDFTWTRCRTPWWEPEGSLHKTSEDSFASLRSRWAAAWRSCGSPGRWSQSPYTWQLHELGLMCPSSSVSVLPAGRGFQLENTCQRERWDALWEMGWGEEKLENSGNKLYCNHFNKNNATAGQGWAFYEEMQITYCRLRSNKDVHPKISFCKFSYNI